MQILTVSSGKAFRRCPREYEYRYEQGLVPHGRAETLRFGTLIHSALEAWWWSRQGEGPDGSSSLEQALLTLQGAQDVEQFERTKAEVMLLGYHTRWQDSPLRPLAVEQEFCCPLVNPTSGAASRTWELRGKIDLIATDGERTWIVEHKTSTEDVSTGSTYWAKLRLDSQVSTYFVGAQSLGYDVAGCVYDVLGKPVRARLLATPMEARKYTKGSSKACPLCAKKNSPPPPHAVPIGSDGEMAYCVDGRVITEEGGRLYAGQRAVDEAPEEYWQRLVDLISPEPERWFVRGEVVRLDEERIDAAADTWQIARMIRESQLSKRWPRNPDTCSRYGRMCDYWPLCTRTGSLHDYSVKAPHEELSGVQPPAVDSQGGHIIPVFIGEPVVTASNLWGVPWGKEVESE